MPEALFLKLLKVHPCPRCDTPTLFAKVIGFASCSQCKKKFKVEILSIDSGYMMRVIKLDD